MSTAPAAGAVGGDGTILRYHSGSTTADPSFILHPSTFTLSAFPNPFNASTTLHLNLAHASALSLDVFDLTGRKVDKVFSGTLSSGEHSLLWSCPTCASGIYLARLQSGKSVIEHKIVLLK